MDDMDVRIGELMDEANASLGMIFEIEAKIRLYKMRMKESLIAGDELKRAIIQMESDYSKYSRKIDEIYWELQSYGAF
jgi:hypothetical protein